MQQVGRYVLSLTASAILCGIVMSIFQEGTVRRILHIVCALILTITAITPLTDYKIPDFFRLSDKYFSRGKPLHP